MVVPGRKGLRDRGLRDTGTKVKRTVGQAHPTEVEADVGKRVLVTGCAGAVGKAVCWELMRCGHWVRGFDLISMPAEITLNESLIGSIQDRAALDPAMSGIDVVVHLAAQPDQGDFYTQIVPNNIIGTYNVFEAARAADVKRVVLASTVQVVSGIDWTQAPIKVEHGTAPTNTYALSKVFAEELGRMYARLYAMSVIAVRIGWFARSAESARQIGQGGRSIYLSPGDAGRFFERCVRAEIAPNLPPPGCAAGPSEPRALAAGDFHILFASSRPPGKPPLDLETAKRVIGYEPQHTYPEGAPQ